MTSPSTRLDEFALIRAFFTQQHLIHAQNDLGVGDDAALFRVASDHQCVVTTDALVSGRHFFPEVDPYVLGRKALAVNLSDLAAMGAEPIGFTLALALPHSDADWLQAFSQGLFDMAQSVGCDLIGGDTTRSEQLLISITALGQVPLGHAIRRDGACEGDDIWVSGELGDAALALNVLMEQTSLADDALLTIRHRLENPTPRVALGRALRGVAHAMCDVSDGLVSDLRHILKASRVSARIDLDCLPLSDTLRNQPIPEQWRCAVTVGDDYELCFTASPDSRTEIALLAVQQQVKLTRIGSIISTAEGQEHQMHWDSASSAEFLHILKGAHGYNHFL